MTSGRLCDPSVTTKALNGQPTESDAARNVQYILSFSAWRAARVFRIHQPVRTTERPTDPRTSLYASQSASQSAEPRCASQPPSSPPFLGPLKVPHDRTSSRRKASPLSIQLLEVQNIKLHCYSPNKASRRVVYLGVRFIRYICYSVFDRLDLSSSQSQVSTLPKGTV